MFLPVVGSDCCRGRPPGPEGRAEGVNVISCSYCSVEEKLRVKGTTVSASQTKTSHLFYGQLFESRQRAGEEAYYKGGRSADDIQHGGWEHGDVRMLPGEGVEQSHDCMTTLRQCAAEKEKRRRR